ncbi:MAG: hypothetical protein CVT68_08495 [Actinobacteria bacterium HGW-Actinobacteria-8]|nr:MAG: hypothetical protein CVT68_08495 [Actinobacteria bacterium HGW-Actinobacteria-8]
MTDNTGLPAAGWKDDPEDSAQLRYWDGAAWTEHRSPKAGTAQPGTAQPEAVNAMVQDGTMPKKSGAPWWLVAVIGVVTLFIGVGIGAATGGAGGDDDAVAAPTTSAGEAPASEDPASDEAASAEPAPDASGGAGTATDPRAIDVPWTYDTSWFGEAATVWEGTFEGLMTLSVDDYDDDAGSRCFAVVGTMSPTSIADDAFTTSYFDTPDFQVIVAGAVQDEYGFCDTDALDAAGYGPLIDAEVSVGTAYKFYEVVYLPSSVTGDVDLIVLGSASDSEALFYQATPAAVG